jgi:uncharacterized protein with NRDE domain
MCLIVFGYDIHPDYKLIFAGNRDEFYQRPAVKAHFWDDKPEILGGRDAKAGGTWLGVNRSGEFAAITNYRDIPRHDPNAKSRGHIITDYLSGKMSWNDYLQDLHQNDEIYNGYNLIAGDLNGMGHYSNYENEVNVIKPGVHGISNALLNTPWFKVEKAKDRFEHLLNTGSLDDESLFSLLTDSEKAVTSELPETGLEPEMEKAVSSIFIKTPDYGSRCSTLLYIKRDGTVRFVERSYHPQTSKPEYTEEFEFVVQK